MKDTIKPLINHFYCMKVYAHMVKKRLTMHIDGNKVLWHINDLKEILEPKRKAK